jgi:glucose-1-phosphate adenylyltransferase
MGIYIFKRDVLVRALEDDAAAPTASTISAEHHPVADSTRAGVRYRFYDENKKAAKYWRDIGTLDAYFEASMDLCQVNPEFNLYDPEWPLRTYQPQAPPAKFVFAEEGRVRTGARLGDLAAASSREPRQRQHSLPERARAQLLRHRAAILMPACASGATRASAARSSIATCSSRAARSLDSTRKKIARRHSVTDGGVVVVTAEDEPLIGSISEEALEPKPHGGPRWRNRLIRRAKGKGQRRGTRCR